MNMQNKKIAVLYVHGKGGNAAEAEHYKALFPDAEVTGLDYHTDLPWETNLEIENAVSELAARYDHVFLIANSIGAFYSMNADICEKLSHAYFISPMVDLEKLILNMMTWANVTEEDLKREKTIKTDFGEELSWEYLCYVREHPIKWTVPTDILRGSEDELSTAESIEHFIKKTNASLTVMQGGEHWFHTKEQMEFLDKWITDATARCFTSSQQR
ncbi:alpha/beta hydrolase [Oribacterium sp. C9]|uniref:alpha/beta hydrolase n=1 Tax=Oribacterium sp. C9 TaxID=1943579 RepID=UPI001FA93EF8|nr:alpha/beta hydrolase [Oribacterium sp. C9]